LRFYHSVGWPRPLPAEVLANPPDPVLAKSADQYASDLKTDRRTIYRWLALGRTNKDPVPLDEPAKMLAWWARNMKHRVPEYLNDWVSRTKPTVAGTVPAASNHSSAGAGAPPPAAQPDRVAIDLGKLTGHGLEAAVLILRQNVEATAKLLSAALNDPNDQRLAHYQSRFEEAVEQLRKAEGSLLTLQKARGDLAPRSEFRSDLHTLITGLRGMMRRRADNICATLSRHLSLEQIALVRAAVVAQGASEEQLLRTSRHWQVTPAGELQFPAA
jgi:hypothetical protein